MADYKCDLVTALNFAIQALEILEKIHAQGVVYRDVKPENFCLSAKANSSGNFKVQIIDFGLAMPYMVKKEEPEASDEKAPGTPIVKKAPKM